MISGLTARWTGTRPRQAYERASATAGRLSRRARELSDRLAGPAGASFLGLRQSDFDVLAEGLLSDATRSFTRNIYTECDHVLRFLVSEEQKGRLPQHLTE